MGLSDLSKQLDDREQTSTKSQPYAMGRQTVRKARTDLTNKDFDFYLKTKYLIFLFVLNTKKNKNRTEVYLWLSCEILSLHKLIYS